MPLPLSSASFPEGLLAPLLAVSLTGVFLLRPLYDSASILDDFVIEYVNPAGQRMAGLPERPSGTLRTHFPHSLAAGVVPFYRRTFETGQPETFEVNYQADSLDNYFHLAAQRHGEWLVVSFTDTADQARTPVETALRESQAAERAARQQVEQFNQELEARVEERTHSLNQAQAEVLAVTRQQVQQRETLYQVFEQTPAMVQLLRGPHHHVAYVNPAYQHLFPGRTLVGLDLAEAVPELREQGFITILDDVYQTGETYFGLEVPLLIDQPAGQPPRTGYFTFTYQPYREEGQLVGISLFAHEVSEQALTRLEQEAQREQLRVLLEREAQREQLQAVFMQTPVAVCVFQGERYVLDVVNPRMAELLGYPLPALVGQPLFDVLPELRGQGVAELLARVGRTGTPFVAQEQQIQLAHHLPGGFGYYNFVYQPLLDAQRTVTGIVFVATDVTEQVLARQQVQALNEELVQAQAEADTQRQRLHHLITEAPALIASLRGPAHVVELANEGYRATFGGRDLMGKPYREAFPDFEAQPFFDRLDRVYRTGKSYHGVDEPVLLDRTNSGRPERTYFTYTYQATRDAQGQIDGILVFGYEVTEQVLARQERETQRQRLHDLFMQAPAAICILDGPELVHELVNPSYQTLFPGRDLLGKPLLEALPEVAGHPVQRTLLQVYETGTTWQELGILLPVVRPDGVLEDRYFNYTQQARFDAQGHVDGVLVLGFEVTEQVLARQQVQELNEELAAINEELQASNEELGDSNHQLTRVNVDLDNFIYTASHDLKAPISNIEGLLFLLREDLPADVAQSPHIAPTLTRMLGAVERFKRTIEHLTEVTKLQKEHTRPTASIDLAAVVQDVLLDLDPLLREANAQLRVEVSDFPLVRFSEKNLRSVVYNLLSNALKYRHPDRRPHIDVQAHVRPGYTVLEVHDNGLGLDQTQLSRLFNLFQRFHSHVEGTGIGLYMVKRMVENAGGRIEVHSRPEGGTTFFVYLPNSAPPRT